ncbi:DUF4397 domain-containing protein [Rheinheimera marina]|uniref:DUF4397 domain-containing protein n=1 Tax=Rheinheimera marina TaxID=1774958 RepID=A0ABV9JKE0_9GAMM
MNLKTQGIRLVVPLLSALVLAACGGSSSDSNEEGFNKSYIQFYNGAANSANTSLTVKDTAAGTATFGDASNMLTIDPGSYTYQLKNAQSSALIKEATLDLKQSEKTLLVMTGDVANPTILSLVHKREESFDDQFRAFSANLSVNYKNVDLYTAGENEDFSKAVLLESLSDKELTSTGKMIKRGKLKLFLAVTGQTTPFFESAAYDFKYTTSYVLIVRDKIGPMQQQVAVDILLNSTTVESLEHKDAKGQIRIYNSLDNQQGQIAINNLPVADLQQDSLTPYLEFSKGDYSISVLNEQNQLLLNNVLLTVNSGQTKAVALFKDADNKVGLVNFVERNLPQIHEHEVNVLNLIPDFKNLHFYFVRANETIETARYHVKALEFKKQQAVTLPDDLYSISLVQVADNGTISLLDKTALLEFVDGANYILTAEPSAQAPSGYKINLVK